MTQALSGELSERELEILRRVATGATNQQIAFELSISVNTVKAHLRNIFGKLGVESRTEATLYAIQQGLIAVASATDEGIQSAGALQPAPEAVPALSPFQAAPWPFSVWQGVALALALLLVIAVAVWPNERVSSAPSETRMVDISPRASPDVAVAGASRWRTRAQMSEPRGRFAQALVDNKIYVIGGLTEVGWSDLVEVYDPQRDRWEQRAAKPTAAANIGAAVVGGRIYVPGGLDAQNQVRDLLEIYDPIADAWNTGAHLPIPLCAYAIAATEEGFYLFGGWDGQRYVNNVLFYDAALDQWRQEAPLNAARGFAAAAALGDRIYLVGGYDGAIEYRSCESFEPALAAAGQNPWRQHASMSVARAGHSVAVHENDLYVVGGGWNTYFAYNERYDTANDAWSTFESPIIGEWRALGLSAATTGEGAFLYAIGGWNGRYLSTVQTYQAFYRIFIP